MACHHSFTSNVISLLALTFHSSHQRKLRSEHTVCQSKHRLSLICCRPWSSGLRPCGVHEIPTPIFAWSLMFALANISFRSMPGFHAFIANAISMINAWYKGKVCWYPHAIKLLHHTEKYAFLNATEQHFYIWEPHCGYLHKMKNVCWYPLIKECQWSHNIGKWSRTPISYTTNRYVCLVAVHLTNTLF